MLRIDSREVRPGDRFLAVRGAAQDGARFIPAAIAAGAAHILSENPPPADLPSGIIWEQIRDSRETLAQYACAQYGNPSRELLSVAVTGTNGKTTIANLVRWIFTECGTPCALLSTIENIITPTAPTTSEERAAGLPPRPGHGTPAKNTTPGPLELQALLRGALTNGCRAVTLELSSHALDQKRADGSFFTCAVFSNLTQDHLDYHKTVAAYFEAKCRLFRGAGTAPRIRFAVLNADDPRTAALAQSLRETRDPSTVLTYGFSPGASLRIEDAQFSSSGTRLSLRLPSGETCAFQSWLLGRHNASNLAAAFAAALVCGVSPEAIAEVLSRVSPVRGRLERVLSPLSPASFFVDYAHTPDALEKVLTTLHEIPHHKLSIVFGAGGDRDRTKRPLMCQAALAADEIFLTSDNPRSEDPAQILNDVLAGAPPQERSRITVLPDRAEAIRLAASRASHPEDIVLIAGKGHETYQIFADKTIHFDDREILTATKPPSR